MLNKHHEEILNQIIKHAGKPTQHTFSDRYLGNDNPRYPINVPTLRKIAKEWIRSHDKLTSTQFSSLLTSLVKGKSSTEKCFAGILLNYSTDDQQKFDPKFFDSWLDHLQGWAEIDSLCTGSYTVTGLENNWNKWKTLLAKLSKSKNINKRRASIVFLCSPLRNLKDERLAQFAFMLVDQLKAEKEILITKAISWVLRSMDKHYQALLSEYIRKNKDSLPKIAVREVLVKLKTGTKTKRKGKIAPTKL